MIGAGFIVTGEKGALNSAHFVLYFPEMMSLNCVSLLFITVKYCLMNLHFPLFVCFFPSGIAMYFITQTAKDILHKTLEAHETEKEDDVLVDEERPNFRGSVPEIKSAAVFKPLLNDSKDGHKL